MGRTVRAAAAVTREDDGCSPSPEEHYTHALCRLSQLFSSQGCKAPRSNIEFEFKCVPFWCFQSRLKQYCDFCELPRRVLKGFKTKEIRIGFSILSASRIKCADTFRPDYRWKCLHLSRLQYSAGPG